MAAAPAMGAYLMSRMQKRFAKLVAALGAFSFSGCLLADTHVLILQGLAGEEYYQRQFDEQIDTIQTAADNLPGTAFVTTLAGEEATRDAATQWFARVAETASDEDRVLFYYIGHGSFDDVGYKFNLPGPDLTDEDLKSLMDQISVELKLVVNTSSSSGALLELFEEDAETILLTATKSGRERNATRFGRFFVEALAEESADLDKNQTISAKEAFQFAERQTQDYYESEGLIATEHAVLQGEHANLMVLASLRNIGNTAPSGALAGLYEQRDQIDLEIDRLRMRRIGMSGDDYRQEFQSLMIRLSMLQAQIDDQEAGGDGGELSP